MAFAALGPRARCTSHFVVCTKHCSITNAPGGRPVHTAGCNFVKIFATPGWRNSLQTYSRQYQ
ncbi:hypothetical protein BRC92_03080 [Halobacteriales archaeon QS_4_69_31]|nr:MAG: hypothetical protein BRC92_03080 [Halobacteriales archaeon QS_4_69_31]